MCICLHCTGCAGQRRQLCGPGAVSVWPLLYGLLNRAGSGGNKIQNGLCIKENLPKLRLSKRFFSSSICHWLSKYLLNNRENIFSYVTRKSTCTAKTLHRKFETNIPRNETVGSYIPTFMHLYSCILYLQQNMQTDPGNIEMAHRYMIVELGTRPRSFIAKNI
jgi:hypothetical protein